MSLKVEYKSIKDLIPYVNNTRTHSEKQVQQVASSIKEFGFTNPILIDEDNGIIAGHGRLLAAQKLNLDNVPTITLAGLSKAQKKAYVIADNKLALNAGWDEDLLRLELQSLKDMDFDITLTGFDLDEINLDEIINPDDLDYNNEDGGVGSLSEKFLIAPFTVLNAREGWWQDRKRSWINLGIKSEEGRNAPAGGSPDLYARQNGESGTSVFDPVLCELAYRWFSPEKGVIVDPFAGGSVRGIVASKLNRQYIGHELRAEQVEANRKQGTEICFDEEIQPVWIEGDSRNILNNIKDIKADFLFSCPPYADLEVYSDDPKDLSTLSYEDFREAYFDIINKSCQLLKDNAFACFVVGDVRDKKGNYYNFVGDTIEAFKQAGLNYYNEAVLITPCGSVAMRAGNTFSKSRKLGKTHQNILVFVKGDGKKAAENCGQIEIDENLFNIEE